jgi:hypothetical protein
MKEQKAEVAVLDWQFDEMTKKQFEGGFHIVGTCPDCRHSGKDHSDPLIAKCDVLHCVTWANSTCDAFHHLPGVIEEILEQQDAEKAAKEAAENAD